MKQTAAVGRNAASRKYDLLTALGVHACHGDKHLQRLVLRFITLIVARYNWQGDELGVGQREIAAMWAVDERTVKRDMARLRDLGWLVVKRPAVRGRVAVHGIDFAAILRATAPQWAAVGTDFRDRMSGGVSAGEAGSNVVAFPRSSDGGGSANIGPADVEPGSPWQAASLRLMAEDPALYGAWFAALRPAPERDGVFHLIAPSRFHATFVTTHHLARLQRALQRGAVSVSAP